MKTALTTVADHLTAFILGAAVALAFVWGIDVDPDLDPSTEREPVCTSAPCPVPSHGTPDPQRTVDLFPPAPGPEESSPVQPDGMSDDTPGWNCLTMGDRVCGPEWDPMPDDTFEHIQSRPQTATDYCLWLIADTTLIVCSDGLVATS